jgi:hypothetical protein
MSTDPIVEEIDRLRAETMESYRFDFEAFFRDLKEQERQSQQPIQSPPESPSRERSLARAATGSDDKPSDWLFHLLRTFFLAVPPY